jgi:hypothetical protein
METFRRTDPIRVLVALAFCVGLPFAAQPSVAADAPGGPGVEFFEKKIRPVLVEQCAKCHSAEGKKAKGGLRVDSPEALREGGQSGPAVVPGKPEESLILEALRYTDEVLRMPPKGKLPERVVTDFETWIGMGAPMPHGVEHDAGRGAEKRDASQHWAFQPIHPITPPAVKQSAWLKTPLDRLILAKLEGRGLAPSPPADRRTLIRRAYFDLVGLPPSAEEVEAFVADQAPDAFDRVIDRLLASPRYGERWGRHWLDVARYADTKDGVLMFGDDRVRPYAYTYRDYVVRAFNDDVPFDRFIHEQIAADLIEPKVEPWRLAAMGFLTVGRLFDDNIHDVIDDRIDVVTRGLLGLSVACARCHDHKYDPIPTADYYSLYGVFASSEVPLELPRIRSEDDSPGAVAFEKKAGPKRQELKKFQDDQYAMLLDTARTRVGDYLVHVASTEPDPLETAIFFLSLAPDQLRPQIIARWRRFLEQSARPDDPVLGPWHDLMRLSDAEFTGQAGAILDRWRAKPAGVRRGQVNPLVMTALASTTLTRRADVARTYGDLLRGVYEESKKSPASTMPEAKAQLVALVAGPDSPTYFPRSRTREYMSRTDKDAFGGKRQEVDRIAVQSPHAPPRAMILQDAEQLYDPKIFIRGNPGRPGAAVSRQFLREIAGAGRQPFPHGSGRLDLARAITAGDNPLTARVIVNRVWMHHFGEPLVDTPNDFGTRSSAPIQRDLLDQLAVTLRESGWSLKSLHRLIMRSSTYQQASADRADGRQMDPDNRLFWRMNRRRLDLESMRDSMLAISGRLDATEGGRPVDVVGDARNRRRTIYGLVDRQNVPGLYRAFDFASPDLPAERRSQTTVPQQALFGMNAPFVMEQAQAIVARPEFAAEPDTARRIAALYRLVLRRAPDGDETRVGLQFLAAAAESREGAAPSKLDPWAQYAQVLLITNEAMFVD